jgi:hypothetical protein
LGAGKLKKAIVPNDKLKYLLGQIEDNQKSVDKGRLYQSLGYKSTLKGKRKLEKDIWKTLREGTMTNCWLNQQGEIQFQMEAKIVTPNGKVVNMRSGWVLRPADSKVQFVNMLPTRIRLSNGKGGQFNGNC